jgi:hypothetical protein
MHFAKKRELPIRWKALTQKLAHLR